MPVSPARLPIRATRRTTIAAGAALALAGCRFGPADEDGSATEPEPDADAELVSEAADALVTQVVLLDAVAQTHVGLVSALAPITAAHRAHLELLGGVTAAGLGSPAPGPVSHSARAALATVRAGETSLQASLAELSVAVVSGTLARALASMSASTAQHLAVLPTLAGGPA